MSFRPGGFRRIVPKVFHAACSLTGKTCFFQPSRSQIGLLGGCLNLPPNVQSDLRAPRLQQPPKHRARPGQRYAIDPANARQTIAIRN